MTRIRLSSMLVASGAALVAVVALAACAPSSGDNETARPPSFASAGSPTAGPVADHSSPPPEPAGKVTVSTSADKYVVGGMITASITNRLDRPIYTDNSKTACTIAYVQRQDGGGWTDISSCRMDRPTLTVSLGPGQIRTVSFDSAFARGTYRIRFTYRMTQEVAGDDPLAAYSAEFSVG
jgi:hypothetical protein